MSLFYNQVTDKVTYQVSISYAIAKEHIFKIETINKLSVLELEFQTYIMK